MLAVALVVCAGLLAGCSGRRGGGPPARQPGAASGTVVVQQLGGYVALDALASAVDVRPAVDELATLYTWDVGARRICAAPGLYGVLADGAYIPTPAGVYVLDGRLYVPRASADAVRERLAQLPRPLPPIPFSVVLDPGHGGRDPGAIGPTGLKEKTVTLAVTLRLDAFLRSHGVKTTLTRRDDSYPTLQQRVAIANRAMPDLFLSVHANAHGRRSPQGFEIFDHDTRAGVAQRARECAAVGPHPKQFNGKPFPLDTKRRRVAYEALLKEYRRDSHRAALCIQRRYKAALPLVDRGIKGEKLHLLRWSRCPTLLVETAFLSNRHEETLLKDPAFRQKIAVAIGRGILDYRQHLAATGRK